MNTPKLSLSEVETDLINLGLDVKKERIIVASYRGYYANTYGVKGKNDRGVYDDATFVVTPTSLSAYQSNVDPSLFKTGIATLQPGVYDLVKWKHQGKYDSLQIVRDVLARDGRHGVSIGRHGINIHYGSDNLFDTWSEGCQTIPKTQYPFFIRKVYDFMDLYKKQSIKYVLIEK